MNCKTKESLTFQNIKHLVTIIYFLDTPVTIYTLSLNLNEDGRKTLTHTLKNRINILPATGRRMMTKNRRFFDVDVS